jgi:leucyl-tRNA synthetase
VPTKDVRWVDGRPLAPEADVALEEVVEKMSKSRGNVVNPDDVIAEYGADSMRLYEMFIGPLQKAAPWSTEGIPGVFRFLKRVYALVVDESSRDDSLRALDDSPGSDAQQRLLARTVHDVTRDFEALEFNTAIAKLMVFVRDIEKDGPITRPIAESLVKLVAPLAPHLAEELWARLGHATSLAREPWPVALPELLTVDEVELTVQVNGKVRANVRVPAGCSQEDALAAALAAENVSRHVGDAKPKRVVYVPGRLLNIVV